MSKQPESLLRIERVIARSGLGRTEVYDRMRRGEFPTQIKVGRLSVWVESEVDAWVRAQIQKARAPSGRGRV